MRDFVLGQGWKYALVAVAAFLIGSAAVVSAAGPIKLFALSDESGARVADVTAGGELLVNTMGSDVAVTNFPAVHDIVGSVEVSNLSFDGDGNLLVASDSLQPQLITLIDNIQMDNNELFFTPYINVEGYSRFKLFARVTGPLADGIMTFSVIESMDGTQVDGGPVSRGIQLFVQSREGVIPFEGLILNLKVRAEWGLVTKDDAILPTQNVSVFLYMVP